MRKNFFYAAALVLGLAFTATACSDDDDNSTVNPADIEYNSENAASWHNYMRNVAALLKADATNLYDSWNTSCLLYTSDAADQKRGVELEG